MGWFTKKKKGETTEDELQEVQTQETVAEAEEVETEKEISEVPSETVDTEIPAEIPADEPGEAPAPAIVDVVIDHQHLIPRGVHHPGRGGKMGGFILPGKTIRLL